MKHAAILTAAALALAACGQGEGTNISITTENGSAGVANGVASIDVPGLKGKVTLPRFKLDAGDVDIDGVKLFPGSTVANFDVNVKGKDDGRVRLAFDSPASIEAVRDHFRAQFQKAGFKASDDGTGLAGRTAEDKPFTLTLSAAGDNRSKGVFRVN